MPIAHQYQSHQQQHDKLYSRVEAYFKNNEINRIKKTCPTRAVVDGFGIGVQLAKIKRDNNFTRITADQRAKLGEIVESFKD